MPPGAVFSLFSFTDRTRSFGVSFNKKDRFRIYLNALNLWGIAEIGDTFICFGILPFMSSYSTRRARLDIILPLASAEKLSMVSSAKADSCGTLVTAAWISSLVQLRPVLTGHPIVAYFGNVSYAG